MPKRHPLPIILCLALMLALSGGVQLVAAQETGNLTAIRAHVSKGNYLLGQRQFQAAINEYEAALKLDPGNQVAKNNIAEVHNSWAISFFNQNKYGDALTHWEQALAVAPHHAHSRRNLTLMKQKLAAQGVPLESLSPEVSNSLQTPPPGKPEPTAAGALTPKAAPEEAPPPPPSGAVLLTPGIKATPTELPPEPSPPPVQTPAQRAAALNATIFGQPASLNQSKPEPEANSTLFPVLPSVSQPASRPGAVTGAGGAAPNLESDLTAVEMKVYGAKQGELTVLQRLEKMEKDTAGQIRTGTIIDRIEYLKHNFGL